MYKGTYDGDLDEINFVRDFNSNKDCYKDYLRNFDDYSNLWMTRVTTKQMSKLSEKKVYTRSDCYLIKVSNDIRNILIKKDYYLSEEILNLNQIEYTKIPYSGISIKMANSKSFQILKLGPNSFRTLFDSYELGAGASIFCQRKEELIKNPSLIEGWKTSINDMTNFYIEFTNGDTSFYLNQQICKNIKNYACHKIKNIIETSQELQRKIFNGIGLYEEPYTAHYFYQGQNIKKLTMIPYNVTTGSGRSKGDYTIVLKP